MKWAKIGSALISIGVLFSGIPVSSPELQVLETRIWTQSSGSWQVLTPDTIPLGGTLISFKSKVRNSSNKPINVTLYLNNRESPTKTIAPRTTDWTATTNPIKLDKSEYTWELALKTATQKILISGMWAKSPNQVFEIDSRIYINSWADESWSNVPHYLAYTATRDLARVRVKFDLSANTPVLTAYGRIHKNGIPLGTKRMVLGQQWQSFSEDFSIVKGNTLDLWGKHNGFTEVGNYAQAKNFRAIYGDILN